MQVRLYSVLLTAGIQKTCSLAEPLSRYPSMLNHYPLIFLDFDCRDNVTSGMYPAVMPINLFIAGIEP